jgi:hypothetical protein
MRRKGRKESECDGVEGDGKEERSQSAMELKETERMKGVSVRWSGKRRKVRKESECG